MLIHVLFPYGSKGSLQLLTAAMCKIRQRSTWMSITYSKAVKKTASNHNYAFLIFIFLYIQCLCIPLIFFPRVNLFLTPLLH